MLRKLPTVRIADTEFIVDLRLNEFRQQEDPHNRISLYALFPIEDAKLGFFYDPQTKNVFDGSLRERHDRPDVTLIELPRLSVLDPEGTKERIREATGETKHEPRKDVTMNAKDEFLLARKTRKGRGM